MKLPLINLPAVYHVGALNPADRGAQFPSSYEGAWLSASTCPDAWTEIAKLGGLPTWALEKADAFYLDAHAMEIAQMMCVLDWARSKGLVVLSEVWRVSYSDSEQECDRFYYVGSKQEADDEAPENPDDNIKCVKIWTLTQTGCDRALQWNEYTEADNYALQFWVEDVLSEDFPLVAGIAWQEEYSPKNLSAPRIAIAPHAIEQLTRVKLDDDELPNDEDLLEDQSETQWLSAAEMLSASRPREKAVN